MTARPFITLSRTGEYFDPVELRKLTGLDENRWHLAVCKELVDNALDAAEMAGAEVPSVLVWLTPEGVSVSDNGNGIAADTVAKTVDFEARTSDKVRYKTPTRGAQGNALKTVLGIAYNASPERPVVIDALGTRHLLTASVDGAGGAVVTHETEDSDLPHGTAVFVPLRGIDADAVTLARLLRRFALFNPHAEFRLVVGEADLTWGPTSPGFVKPKPSDKACPYWYGAADFAQLVGALAVNRPDLPIHEFCKLFRGGSGKAAAVRSAIGGARTIGDLNGGTDALRVALRDSIKAATPSVLGPLKAHLLEGARDLYQVAEGSEEHKHIEGTFDHDGTEVPFALDVVFAAVEDEAGDLAIGINHSPCYSNPFSGSFRKTTARDDWRGYGLDGFLSAFYVRPGDRDLVAVHLCCPNVQFSDYAKARANTDPFREALTEAVYAVCVKSYRAKRKHEREQQAAQRVREELTRQYHGRPEKLTVRDAVLAVIPEAAEKASEGGTVEFPQRNLFYVVRDLLQRYDVDWERTKEGRLEYPNFTSILREYEETRGDVPCMYQDPRGTFIEPHTGQAFPVGTREVEGYEFPSWTFNAVLYVEKEGFNPKLQQVKLAERYDLAILSGKGFSTRAGRRLLARLADEGCKLAVVHDCDLAGYEIARTLQAEARGCKALEVVDLGLTWEDAREQGLQSETYTLARKPPAAFVQRARRGEVSEEAFRWLTGRDLPGEGYWRDKATAQRFELNAFALEDFVTWLEAKLRAHGFAEKVVPTPEVVTEKAQEVVSEAAVALAEEALRDLVDWERIVATAAQELTRGVSLLTEPELRSALADNPSTSWRSVLDERQREALRLAVDKGVLRVRLQELLKAG